jgi:hypothetical protein
MPLPGPKPVDRDALQTEAMNWARVLFILRDGKVGLVEVVKWGPLRTVTQGPTQLTKENLQQMKGTQWENAQELPVSNRQMRTGKVLTAKIYTFNEFQKNKSVLTLDSPYVWFPPTPASRAVWDALKKSNSLVGMRRALCSLEKYLCRNLSGWYGREFPHGLEGYAQDLLAAKDLHNYPNPKAKQKRPSSDDKRVIFFAKVFAGLRLNLKPSYATKKLSHWRFEKDWATNPYNEFVKSIRSTKGDLK